MSEGIIIAIITSTFTFLGVVITVLYGNKKTRDNVKEHTNLTLYRIQQLEKKQDKHNTLIERMYKVEDRLSIDEEKLRVANHRIDDLEHIAN